MARKKEDTPRAKMVRAARTDADGVYQGMEEVPEGGLTPNHLPQITECDLPAGKYRWVADEANPMGGSFVPIPKRKPDDALKDPDAVRAIALGFVALHSQGAKLPPETLGWLSKYVQSFDFKGE